MDRTNRKETQRTMAIDPTLVDYLCCVLRQQYEHDTRAELSKECADRLIAALSIDEAACYSAIVKFVQGALTQAKSEDSKTAPRTKLKSLKSAGY